MVIHQLLANWATCTPDAVAIEALERVPLTYHRLYTHMDAVVNSLRQWGIDRQDRVAVVLPNGPEMAVTFLAVASGATCAPLNPSYQAPEFDFFLSDLNAKAVILPANATSPVIKVANARGIEIIELTSLRDKAAGLFTLSEPSSPRDVSSGFAAADDIALILHTSGTTSRPKIVPLTHSNLCTSASNIRNTLLLTPEDRCLNVMPLFHIHGLIGATLSSITAGACIICSPGFYAPQFLKWVAEFQPTWYSAVPTIHQAILRQVANQQAASPLSKSPLRLIRSSSSALAPQVMAELERVFAVPVIESYGMTEASHQMASNPLPPGIRKPGSVGLPAGPKIGIMDEQDTLVPAGAVGEIVIHGPNVMRGYENNPGANELAFSQGWFRTGDEGYFDPEGYLVLTDRIKEIINRGGEKISPREVDEVLLAHPAILQAVTFAMPHPTLGEEVAAAVVVHEAIAPNEWEIQQFAATRIAAFKVPRRILILDQIPKGPTGKLQRIGLAKKLGLTDPPTLSKVDASQSVDQPPRTPQEVALAQIWADVLGLAQVDVTDNFFEIGGDSLLAAQILARIVETFQRPPLPLVLFLHAPTVEQMAPYLDQKPVALPPAALVALQSQGDHPPFYCVHACAGEVLFLTPLAQSLGEHQPFYALRARGLDGQYPPYESAEDAAAQYRKEIEAMQPHGPYRLAGAGVGGMIAWEMAQQFKARGKQVETLVLFDTLPPHLFIATPRPLRALLRRLMFHVKQGPRNWITVIRTLIHQIHWHFTEKRNPPMQVFNNNVRIVEEYVPTHYTSRIILFVPATRAWINRGQNKDPQSRISEWHPYITGEFIAHIIPGEHLDIFKPPMVTQIAQHLRPYLENPASEGVA
jgi:acyl-CoA synthetase (AMP-forming)/AMP-acid ligase II/thioesterase domain-containing protein